VAGPPQWIAPATSPPAAIMPSDSREPAAGSPSAPGVRIGTDTAPPATRSSSGSSTASAAGRLRGSPPRTIRVTGRRVVIRPISRPPLEPHDDRLRRRRAADLGVRLERHEDVRLGIVGRRVAPRRVIRHEAEGLRATLLEPVRPLPLGDEIDDVAVREALLADVVGVREHDAPAAMDAAVAIVLAVDRRVELVVRPQRLQEHAALGDPR